MINICPKCSNVTYDDEGWMYANKYNSTRFCLCCGTAMNVYPDGSFFEHELEMKEFSHQMYLMSSNAKRDRERMKLYGIGVIKE